MQNFGRVTPFLSRLALSCRDSRLFVATRAFLSRLAPICRYSRGALIRLSLIWSVWYATLRPLPNYMPLCQCLRSQYVKILNAYSAGVTVICRASSCFVYPRLHITWDMCMHFNMAAVQCF